MNTPPKSVMAQKLQDDAWLMRNVDALRTLFPTGYIRVNLLFLERLAKRLQMLGAPCQHVGELPWALSYLLEKNIFSMERRDDGCWVKMNISPVTREEWTHQTSSHMTVAQILREEPPDYVKDAAAHFINQIAASARRSQ